MDEIDADPGEPLRYSAPALEKGLDVMELLAAEVMPLAAREIAQRLGRSMGELFRVLVALERRGYVRRGEDGGYVLSLRLFEVAHRHPPVERLIAAALPEMHALAGAIGQSCHLAGYADGRILVLCRVESPSPWGLMVRVGAAYALTQNSSGRVLLAFQPEPVRSAWLARAAAHEGGAAPPDLEVRLQAIRAQGCEAGPSDAVRGVTSLSAPILSDRGYALAALTVPFLDIRGRSLAEPEALSLLRQRSLAIATRLGFAPPR